MVFRAKDATGFESIQTLLVLDVWDLPAESGAVALVRLILVIEGGFLVAGSPAAAFRFDHGVEDFWVRL